MVGCLFDGLGSFIDLNDYRRPASRLSKQRVVMAGTGVSSPDQSRPAHGVEKVAWKSALVSRSRGGGHAPRDLDQVSGGVRAVPVMGHGTSPVGRCRSPPVTCGRYQPCDAGLPSETIQVALPDRVEPIARSLDLPEAPGVSRRPDDILHRLGGRGRNGTLLGLDGSLRTDAGVVHLAAPATDEAIAGINEARLHQILEPDPIARALGGRGRPRRSRSRQPELVQAPDPLGDFEVELSASLDERFQRGARVIGGYHLKHALGAKELF